MLCLTLRIRLPSPVLFSTEPLTFQNSGRRLCGPHTPRPRTDQTCTLKHQSVGDLPCPDFPPGRRISRLSRQASNLFCARCPCLPRIASLLLSTSASTHR